MGDWQICLKISAPQSLINTYKKNEPNFSRIHLAGPVPLNKENEECTDRGGGGGEKKKGGKRGGGGCPDY